MATLEILGIDQATGQMKRYNTGDSIVGVGTGNGDMLLATEQTVTAKKTFNSGTLELAGATSGATVLNAASVAGSTTVTLPALTGTVVLDTTSSVSGFSWVSTNTALGSSDTLVPTQNAVKSYVDNAVVGALSYQGGYNASTNTPDLDTSPSGIVTGYMYTVTNAGTFFSEEVDVGDVLIANVDDPSQLSDWTRLQRNLFDPINATTVTLTNEAADTTTYLTFAADATGTQGLLTNANLTFSASTGVLGSSALETGNVTLSTGGALRTGTTDGNTVLLQAYDVDGATYTTFGTLTAGNTPTFDLSTLVTIGGQAFVTASSTTTFTNKTFDANATGNSISNIDVADLANGTDGALITWDANGAPTTVAPGDATKALVSNGAGAVPSYQTVEILLSTTTGINAGAAVDTVLYTVPAGKTAIITRAVVRMTNADTVTVEGTLGIGVTADDIFSYTELTGIDTTGDAYMFSNVMGKFHAATAAEEISITSETAYTATTATIAVDLFGYLV